jgi:hypothetical protein
LLLICVAVSARIVADAPVNADGATMTMSTME